MGTALNNARGLNTLGQTNLLTPNNLTHLSSATNPVNRVETAVEGLGVNNPWSTMLNPATNPTVNAAPHVTQTTTTQVLPSTQTVLANTQTVLPSVQHQDTTLWIGESIPAQSCSLNNRGCSKHKKHKHKKCKCKKCKKYKTKDRCGKCMSC